MKFREVVNRFAILGDFDHLDFDQVDRLSGRLGITMARGRTALFVARDLQTLREAEILDGGIGSETDRVDVGELRLATFSRGSCNREF